MTIDEIEKLLREHSKLPKNTSLPDTMLYESLKRIVFQYQTGALTAEQAKQERQRFIGFYEQWQRDKKLYADLMKQYTAFSSIAVKCNKQGCEMCKEIAKFYDGRKAL